MFSADSFPYPTVLILVVIGLLGAGAWLIRMQTHTERRVHRQLKHRYKLALKVGTRHEALEAGRSYYLFMNKGLFAYRDELQVQEEVRQGFAHR